MESCSLRSLSLTSIPQSSLSRYENPFGYFRFLKFPSSMKYPHGTKLKFLNVKAQSSGAMKASSEAIGATPTGADLKENDLVFVAGATGRVGSRTVRELLKLGFRVRGGVRSAQRVESLVQSVKQMKFDSETSRGIQPVEKLEIVECDLEKPDKIRPALGNSSVVICCIGASEKEVFDITGPYRIDYQATKNLIDAATVAKVNHFIMVSSLGTNKIGFPAAILNLFWGVLIWKRRAEEALIASGVPYTIVRPGGMERPTDAYKETHNLTLSQEDTLFGGQVSNLQVAELMACMAENRSLSYCKVVEVIAETTAPLTPMEELLAKIPSQRVEQKESIDRDEPPSTPLKSTVSEEPNAPTEKEPPQPKAVESRPLSPYTAYEDLKPPSSPSPTQSMSTPVATKTSDSVAAPSSASVPPPSSEPLSLTVKDESAQEDVKKARPLSPYTAYADLKPPASPSPTPPVIHNDLTTTNEAPKAVTSDTPTSTPDTPTDITETVAALEAALRTRPLSPYTAYDDLKPPSSPSPTPSGPKDVTTNPSEQVEAVSSGNDVTDTPVTSVVDEEESVVDENLPQKPVHYSSPFHMYEELKPPTSPMPSAPGRS